jgi:circadian clock protein KaiC
MVARQIDLLKAGGITAMATALAEEDETSAVGISSLVDTWLLLRNVESDGERNRLLFVLKSRGTAHSNQVREFVLSSRGIELLDVYVGPAGVLTGSARLAQEARAHSAEVQQGDDLLRRERDMRHRLVASEARLALLQEEIASDRADIERLEGLRQRRAADDREVRSAMAWQRWADPGLADGGGPR